MRIFKLANTWKTMRRIIEIVTKTIASLGYLSLVLFLVVYSFALIGMDLFQKDYLSYYNANTLPRYGYLFLNVIHQ
jgi:hypothetical protein